MNRDINSKNDISPDDIVGGILAYSGLECFSSDKQFLHTFFCSLKSKYPKLFEDFIFSTGEIFPFSRLLERVLTRLYVARIITNNDFGFQRYRMKGRELMIKNSERRLKKHLKILKEAGKAFASANKAKEGKSVLGKIDWEKCIEGAVLFGKKYGYLFH